MKKPMLIAPRSAAHEMLPGPDAERLLASGSWVQVFTPKPRTQNTKNMERVRQRKKESGCRAINVYLPPHVLAEFHAQLRQGETCAQLIERLLSVAADKAKEETHE